jgi:hypothetical protein
MKQGLFTVIFTLAFSILSLAQNVGIGTANPKKLFSVNGSVLIDQENKNTGALDSASLRFGTTAMVGISSNQSGAGLNVNGLNFWTNNINRLTITSSGLVGINNPAPVYPLDVAGTGKFSYLYTSGLYSYSTIQSEFDLVANDDIYAGGDGTVMGKLGVGGSFNSNYALRVIGNGLFTTNLGIDGTLRVDGTATIGGKITNEGKGLVLSNSATTLRAGFSSGTFSLALNAGQVIDITFCIPTFTGGNANVRPVISQFVPGTGAINFGGVNMIIHSVSTTDVACGGGSSVKVRFQNTSGSTANLGTNAILHLLTLVTD